MSDILIGYNKNDFLYVLTDPNQLPSKNRCDLSYNILDSSISCVTTSEEWKDNSNNCIKHEICKKR